MVTHEYTCGHCQNYRVSGTEQGSVLKYLAKHIKDWHEDGIKNG